MKTITPLVFLILLLSQTACNQRKKSSEKLNPNAVAEKSSEVITNEILKNGSSPYEDLIEFALDKNNHKITATFNKIKAEKTNIIGHLRLTKIEQFDTFFERISSAVHDKNYNQIALNSAETYKLIISSMRRRGLIVPKEVSYLDYVGFKLLVQLNEEEVAWNETYTTVYDAVIYWNIIKTDVKKNKGLHNLMNVIVDGLRDAQKTQDKEMLVFAAKANLEAVDLLEEFYKKGSPQQSE